MIGASLLRLRRGKLPLLGTLPSAGVMKLRGWATFPPLVVAEFEAASGGFIYKAFTGAHRYAAAKQAELEQAPCIVIPVEQWRDGGLDYERLRTLPDEERSRELSNVGLAAFAHEILRQNDQIQRQL